MAYRAYLKEHQISYITAGSDQLDGRLAMEKLQELFHIQKVVICGGGVINWSMIQMGTVDELSLLLTPAAEGNPASARVFERSSLLQENKPVEFVLKQANCAADGIVHLIYQIPHRQN